ncbi:MAG TPA: ROK family transcriptional regulator [Candidatus Dormibacteraeota bacterium]|jgi:predicted NBD/HSP70 family sugar kinase|nr:ROK family transcriptional regulator [Candidatus Dormibacteraeota bacterium]
MKASNGASGIAESEAPPEGGSGRGRAGRPLGSREQILHTLRWQPGLSQTDLVRVLGLGQATVSVAIGELIAAGLVVVAGYAKSTGGRRPEHLALNSERPMVLAVDLGEAEAQLCLVNLNGALLDVERIPFRRLGRRVEIAPVVEAARRWTGRPGVVSVGIAAPGIINSASGVVRRASTLAWRDVDLRAIFEVGLGLPVVVERNTNAALLAEEWWGSLVGDPVVFVTLGSGVGAALRVNGTFVHGASGAAGEFGHLTVEADGLRCRCGRHGCLETRASAGALVALYRRLIHEQGAGRAPSGGRRVSVAGISAAAAAGDAIARTAILEVADWLAAGLVTLITLLNPPVVVLGGDLLAAEDILLPRVRQVVRQHGVRASSGAVKIVPSTFRDMAALAGAGAVAFERLFRNA